MPVADLEVDRDVDLELLEPDARRGAGVLVGVVAEDPQDGVVGQRQRRDRVGVLGGELEELVTGKTRVALASAICAPNPSK